MAWACRAAHLSPPAQQAFADYVAGVESRLSARHAQPGMPEPYLPAARQTASRDEDRAHDLPATAIRAEPVHGGTWSVPGGLLHHWRAAAFVPGANSQQLMALLRDYGRLSTYYAPEVAASRALKDDGENAIVAMRFRKRKILTVVLDAEFETRSGFTGADRGYSFSRSSHIWQVDAPGSKQERRRAEGDDDGFLWRLNSYWTFHQMGDGLWMECEAISLTRDVPAGLGWLITPVIQSLPRESLEFTLNATRNALRAGREEHR